MLDAAIGRVLAEAADAQRIFAVASRRATLKRRSESAAALHKEGSAHDL